MTHSSSLSPSFRNDAKTVNVIATACFSPVTKVLSVCLSVPSITPSLGHQVVVAALRFFLTDTEDGDCGESSSDSEVGVASALV